MRTLSIFAAAAVTAAIVMTSGCIGARAEEAIDNDAYAQRLFAGKVTAQKKSYACFVRKYDAAHFAKHPRQKVGAIKLLVSAEIVPEDAKLNYSFRLGVAFRDRPGHFDSSGGCGHPMASEVSADKLKLGCGVDCDGGGLSIELAHRDKATMVRLDRVRIWRHDNANDESDLSLEAGADDGVFRLDRVGLENCKSLMPKDEKLAALQK